MSVATAQRISLEVADGGDPSFALFRQMSGGGYRECSVLEIPATIGDWLREHRTARKRASRCMNRGYQARELKREEEGDAIYRINTSTSERQGRPMAEGYRRRHEFGALPEYADPRHAVRTSGVWTARGQLVAYLVMHRAGELALVSQILGHASYLEDEIMYLLFAFALEREIQAGHGFVVYNRHDSGTDGLRFYKERCGFEERAVEWEA